MKKITLIVVILAVLSGILGFYYYQKNIYSKEILKLEILGPETADLGQEVEYIVKYKNRGDTRLEEPELIFEYPKYSLPVDQDSPRAVKKSEDLGGAIYPGQEQSFRFKARLFGKEGEAKEFKAILSYQPKDLKARYESATTFTTLIKKVPLTFEFDTPSQTAPDKEFRLMLNYFSNVDYPFSNLRVMIEYPSDFEFIESNPRSLEKNSWDVGVLNKAEGGRIEITGRLKGEVGQEKVFQAKIGSWQEGEFVLFQTATKGVEMAQPDLIISQQINNNPAYVASPGDFLHYEISFRNIGDTTLTNLFLISRLEGEAFDFQTLKSDLGDFKAGDNSIVFDWKKVPELRFLDIGEESKVEFWINLKEEWGTPSVPNQNPVLRNKVSLSQAKEEFVTKVNSKIVIEQKGYFKDDVFGNSGSLPPKVGETTSYTIIWQAKNYYSDLRNVKVKTILPGQVKLTGKIFPTEETGRLTFDSKSREIVWSIGVLEAGKGLINSPVSFAFQVSFTPDFSQRGSVAELVGQARIFAEDQWTKDSIEAVSGSNITTALPDDQTITNEMGIVQ